MLVLHASLDLCETETNNCANFFKPSCLLATVPHFTIKQSASYISHVHFLFTSLCLPRLTFSNPHIVFTCTIPNTGRNKFPNSTNASLHLCSSFIHRLLTFVQCNTPSKEMLFFQKSIRFQPRYITRFFFS